MMQDFGYLFRKQVKKGNDTLALDERQEKFF
jgi:hypothetical protein